MGEEKKSADRGEMLVSCVRGQKLKTMPLGERRYVLGKEISIDSSLMSEISGVLERVGSSYVLRLERGGDLIWHNGKKVGQPEGEPAEVVLDHKDVIRIDKPLDESSHAEAAVFVYHSHCRDGVRWKEMDLKKGQVKLHISRHEELKENGNEVLEDLAELPAHYATLIKEQDNWYLEDHSTRFGVYVNQAKVEGRQKLMALDVISIGAALFLYQQDMIYYNHIDAADKCLVVHIEERSVWNLFRKQILLQDIDLSIRPGEMVLILGGSGAGKTTFINAVMGYEKARGKIMEGDIDIYENYNQMKYEIGFVPQQDLLRLEDTVLGTLENAAELKMPKKTTDEERQRRITEVLELFGLEREEESLVGKLSGGQRKRLSIAVEFISDPTLFFLDEPDSGLDGIMARSLMEQLRGIANKDKMVMVITHAPDRGADLFDKVIVLAKSKEDNIGHLAFYGTAEEAKGFFETESLEDIVRRINREDEGGEGLADYYIEKYKEIKEK